MSDKHINPGLKSALELGPVAAFFVGYLYLKDRSIEVAGTEYSGFIVATALFIPVLLASIAVLWRLTGKLSKMQVVTAVLVLVFGGLTVWLNDERFFKMRPTIVFGLFAVILGVGLLRGRSYLAWVMEDLMPLTSEGWMILTRRLAWFFAGLSAANEVIWRNFSEEIWVYSDTFGQPLAIFAFFMLQAGLLNRHGVATEEDAGDS